MRGGDAEKLGQLGKNARPIAGMRADRIAGGGAVRWVLTSAKVRADALFAFPAIDPGLADRQPLLLSVSTDKPVKHPPNGRHH